MNMFEIIHDRLNGKGAFYNDGLKPKVLHEFEKSKNTSLPSNLKEFLLKSNGIDASDELFKFYSLSDYLNLTDHYVLGSKPTYINDFDTNNPIWKLNSSQIIIDWKLKNANEYYKFGDYNFGGTFWAINLNKNSSDYQQIIALSPHVNDYRVCAESFEKFVEIYKNNEIEDLI